MHLYGLPSLYLSSITFRWWGILPVRKVDMGHSGKWGHHMLGDAQRKQLSRRFVRRELSITRRGNSLRNRQRDLKRGMRKTQKP